MIPARRYITTVRNARNTIRTAARCALAAVRALENADGLSMRELEHGAVLRPLAEAEAEKPHHTRQDATAGLQM